MPDTVYLPVTPQYLCPFLGTQFDAATYSATDSAPNYCHRANPAAAVNSSHQIFTCTAKGYCDCPVYTNHSRLPLPVEWASHNVIEQKQSQPSRLESWPLFALMGIIIVILVIWLIASQNRTPGQVISAIDTPTKAFVIPTVTSTVTDTATLTYTPTIQPSSTLTSTSTPDSTLTRQAEPALTASAQSIQQTQTEANLPANQTQTALVSHEGCNLSVSEPTYLPVKRDPPTSFIYGRRPFLIKWQITNTSQSCKWLLVRLQVSTASGSKLLLPMSPEKDQPAIDQEYAMRDENYELVDQVFPGQTVTFVIQINGLEIIRNNGKIERTINLLINGHLISDPKLTANIDQWVIVLTSTSTPGQTRIPTTR
jgi:hypothetical protein